MNVVADPNQIFKEMEREKIREMARKLEDEDNPVAKVAGKIIRHKTDMDEIKDRIIVH